MAACGTGAPGTAPSRAGVQLWLSGLARCCLYSKSSCFFSFWKTGEKLVKEELIHFHAHLLAIMERQVIGKVTTELVTAVCTGFGEFLKHEIQSWSEIHVSVNIVNCMSALLA